MGSNDESRWYAALREVVPMKLDDLVMTLEMVPLADIRTGLMLYPVSNPARTAQVYSRNFDRVYIDDNWGYVTTDDLAWAIVVDSEGRPRYADGT